MNAPLTEPADDHDHERLDQDRHVHLQVYRLARNLQRAGEAGEAGPERKDRGEEQRLVESERARCFAILRRGPHPDAPA
jgi:hypothetical protein